VAKARKKSISSPSPSSVPAKRAELVERFQKLVERLRLAPDKRPRLTPKQAKHLRLTHKEVERLGLRLPRKEIERFRVQLTPEQIERFRPPRLTPEQIEHFRVDTTALEARAKQVERLDRALAHQIWGAVSPPSPAAAQAKLPDYRIRDTELTTIRSQAIIGVIVDRHLYPEPEGLPPRIGPALLQKQCKPHWKDACKANGVSLPLPDFKTFKAFITKRSGRTPIDSD
jgi:hypothetical protein